MQPIVPIKIKGEEHYFHFNNYALIELEKWRKKAEQTNEDALNAVDFVNDLIERNFLLGVTIILYCGLVGYKYSKFQLTHPYKIDELSETVANADMNEWTPIWEAYKEATGMSEFLKKQAEKLKDQEPTTEKKSRHSKKSLNLPSE